MIFELESGPGQICFAHFIVINFIFQLEWSLNACRQRES